LGDLQICLDCQKTKSLPILSSFYFEGKLAQWVRRSKENLVKPGWLELKQLDIPNPFSKSIQRLAYVPSDPQQTDRRGYDSSYELAKVLAQKWRLELISDLFVRKPFFASQKDLNQRDRKKWLGLCMSLNKRRLVGEEAVGIVDDLSTTGSSLQICSQLLQKKSIHVELYSVFRDVPRSKSMSIKQVVIKP